MTKKFTYGYIIGIVIGVILLLTSNNIIAAQDQNHTTTIAGQNQSNTTTTIAGENQFNPVPFNEIPLVVVNYTYGQYKFGADFSLDFGGLPVIEQDISATSVPNMRLDKDDTNLHLELQCDSNDICDTSLAPESVSIYLVDDTIQDIHIAENSIPTIQFGSNDCGSLSIEDCANFDFSIPGNIIIGNYKIVVEMSFDEAEWIFINPVEIVDSTYPSNNNVTVRCDDLAIDLITWDLLIGGTDEPTRTNIEDILGDENVSPALINNIIDPPLERLLGEAKDKCNNLDENVKRVLGEVNFEFLP
ncbi:MAG TPA: hypothetical protein VJ583_04680 [Nitrososphaeraceae archaeon]|nr:hypothetical protein [Nitrososphaeraceae archaeon]